MILGMAEFVELVCFVKWDGERGLGGSASEPILDRGGGLEIGVMKRRGGLFTFWVILFL